MAPGRGVSPQGPHLEELLVVPRLTDEHVGVPPQHKGDQHQQHQQPGEDEAEANPSARTEMLSAPKALYSSIIES